MTEGADCVAVGRGAAHAVSGEGGSNAKLCVFVVVSVLKLPLEVSFFLDKLRCLEEAVRKLIFKF